MQPAQCAGKHTSILFFHLTGLQTNHSQLEINTPTKNQKPKRGPSNSKLLCHFSRKKKLTWLGRDNFANISDQSQFILTLKSTNQYWNRFQLFTAGYWANDTYLWNFKAPKIAQCTSAYLADLLACCVALQLVAVFMTLTRTLKVNLTGIMITTNLYLFLFSRAWKTTKVPWPRGTT